MISFQSVQAEKTLQCIVSKWLLLPDVGSFVNVDNDELSISKVLFSTYLSKSKTAKFNL